jgi:2-hydroxy-6-oxonona-2,4-dienedioate hydrolase
VKEPTGQLRDLWTRIEGLRIYARVSENPIPDRLPVVLVHGYGVSSRYMIPFARRLAAERPVYAPDLPGHGRSEDPGWTLTVPELAGVLYEWMDAAGLGRMILFGNSMGCQIAVELAMRHPERIDRLILAGPTVDPEARTFLRQLPRFVRDAFAERPSLLFWVAWDYLRAGPRRILREMDVAFADRIEDKLPQISMPSLVLRGERDAIVPQSWAEEVAHGLGGIGGIGAGRVEVIRGAGHALNYSAADELMRRIRPFLP